MSETTEIWTHLLTVEGDTLPLPGKSKDGKLSLEEIWEHMGTRFIEPFMKGELVYILDENAQLLTVRPPVNHAASLQLGQEILGPVIKMRLVDMK